MRDFFWPGFALLAMAGLSAQPLFAQQQPPAVPPPTAAQMQINVMKVRVVSDKDDLARSQGMVAASTALLAADEAALAKLEATPAATVTPARLAEHPGAVPVPNRLDSPPAVTIDHGVSRPGYVPPATGAKR